MGLMAGQTWHGPGAGQMSTAAFGGELGPPPKAVLEGYVLTEKLGRGGQGEVWRAVDQGQRDTVAIKFSKGHLVSAFGHQFAFGLERVGTHKLCLKPEQIPNPLETVEKHRVRCLRAETPGTTWVERNVQTDEAILRNVHLHTPLLARKCGCSQRGEGEENDRPTSC